MRKHPTRFVRILSLSILAGMVWANSIYAKPRSPGPPYPDSAPIEYVQTFDGPYEDGATNDAVIVSGVGTYEQSWSGYALQRLGDVTPFIVPGVDSTGWTNVSCASQGAFRFWVKPYWCSSSVTNGENPGAIATVLELDAVSGAGSAVAWSLQVSADGNTLTLFTATDSGLQAVLATSIAWAAGTSHCLVVDWNATGAALYVDGSLAATGSTLASIPPSTAELVLGSTLAGTNSAGADLDEFYSFGKPLTTTDVATYYTMVAPEAALGPLPDDWHHYRHHREASPMADLSPVYDPNAGCSTGGTPYLTNLSAIYNGESTLFSVLIAGGTNGQLYDVYTTYGVDKQDFNWVGQGLACGTVSFADQPADHSFYIVTAPSHTMAVAFGNTTYGSMPTGLSNSIAVAAGGYFDLALQSNGTIVTWGDNTHGQTNVPGITNAVAIAAGQYHGLALLATGSVQMWGAYSDGTNFYPVTNSYPGVTNLPTSNVMGIAAGFGHDLALLSNGTVVSWGLTNLYPMTSNTLAFQSNLTGVKAVACGWNHDVVLLSNGLVEAYGLNGSAINWNLTNVPTVLTDAVSVSASALHSMALRSNGTVVSWGYDDEGQTNVPPGLSNVVAVAAGGMQSIALEANGTLVIWGASGLTNVPPGLVSTKVISGGFEHNLVLQSDLQAPIITQEPMDQYAPAGSNATFTVQAESLAELTYQWQFNGVNLSGQTNASLTLTNTQATNNGSYQVVVSTSAESIISAVATFTLVQAPQILSASTAPTNIWINTTLYLNPEVDAAGQLEYPVGYLWKLNGTNISSSPGSYEVLPTPTNEGTYTLVVSNVAGSNSVSWDVRLAAAGMAEAWGDDTYGECDRPATVTNVAAIAAGKFHSVAITDSGAILQWGEFSDGTNFYTLGSPPSGSNFVAAAASQGHDLALTSSGAVTNWGLTNDVANFVPTNLSPVQALACGLYHNVALLTSNTLVAWGTTRMGN